MDLRESGEMYLETILMLKQKNGSVRSIDIANELNYSKPSVSRGMKILKENKYIVIDDKGYIDFSEEGLEKAKNIFAKHTVLKAYLQLAGVSEEVADNDACRIEHVISEETYLKIKDFIEKQS